MNWLFLSFLASFGVLYLIHRRTRKKQTERALEYHFEFVCGEIFQGEYLYLDQVVINASDRTIPFLKLETLMPEGLEIVLNTASAPGKKDETVHSAESLLVLQPHSQVRRRWRIIAQKRGEYTADQVQMHAVSNDVLGTGEFSLLLTPEPGAHDRLLVLPCASEWLTEIALSPAFMGERTVTNGLIRDPMTICGIREYESFDALNTVDWKQSAKLGRLMVRKTEAIRNDRYNIVLNMQSTLIEPKPPEISAPHYIEECIAVCASLLDSAIRRNIPVRLLASTEPGVLPGGALSEEGVGSRIFCSEEFRTGDSVMEAYRVLARLQMNLSVPSEQLLDDIIANPQHYASGGNIVFVTTFLDQRMLNFHSVMREQGVNVVFFVITSYQNAEMLPPEAEIYFRMTRWVGGVGYGW